jgi:hypothetical protein
MRKVSLLLLFLVISACTPVASLSNREYAAHYGCWPYGAYQPPTPTVSSTPTTPVPAYAECAPLAGTPTSTPTAIPRETPQRAPIMTGYQELTTTAGKNTNGVLATDYGVTVVGWIAWGVGSDEYAGDVWVQVLEHPGTHSTNARTVNIAPVKKNAGGLGLAVLPDNSIIAVFGAGGSQGDTHLYQVISNDGGTTWSLPEPLPIQAGANELDENAPTPLPAEQAPASLDSGGGGVQSLLADPDGGLHLLFLARNPFRMSYAYRPVGSAWQLTDRVTDGVQIRGTMAILPSESGIRRFVLTPVHETSELRIVSSDDGVTWTTRVLDTARYIRPEVIVSLSLLAAQRPDGSIMVAAAWGQYSKGGVFASISLDGGVYWSEEEPIALHQAGGVCYAQNGDGLPCGYQPSLAYDPDSDRLALAWNEVLRGHEPPQRTRLATRVLTPLEPWRFAVTPENADVITPPIVSTWGHTGLLFATPGHQAHWLLTWDSRNQQYRLYVRRINLSALVTEGIS